jgi:hypothetical protein
VLGGLSDWQRLRRERHEKTLRRPAGDVSVGNVSAARRKIYVARVSRRDSHEASVKYVVLARSSHEALRAIRKECSPEWTVQLLPEYIVPRDILGRLNVADGRPKILE